MHVQYYADRLDAAPLHDNDLAICAQLALEAGDWVIHRLELAGIDDDPSEFRIARKISYDAEHLQEEARQQKENDLAMRAFRLMERLKSGQKRQRRPRGGYSTWNWEKTFFFLKDDVVKMVKPWGFRWTRWYPIGIPLVSHWYPIAMFPFSHEISIF